MAYTRQALQSFLSVNSNTFCVKQNSHLLTQPIVYPTYLLWYLALNIKEDGKSTAAKPFQGAHTHRDKKTKPMVLSDATV